MDVVSLTKADTIIALALPNEIEKLFTCHVSVVGPTGSGKSTLIARATGLIPDMMVGHGLQSCTSEIRAIRCKHPDGAENISLVLVDTPGFDDTFKTDTEILQMLADWLKKR